MIERILFLWRFKENFKFLYIHESGMGYMSVWYNIFTDKVYVRSSRFGYVEGDYEGRPWDRYEWVLFYWKNTREEM